MTVPGPVGRSGPSRALPALLAALAVVGCTVVGAPAGSPPAPEPGPTVPAEVPVDVPMRQPEPDRGGDPGLPPSWPARTMSGVRHFEEVRGVWVVRTTMNRAESIRAMVDEAAAAGVNTLLLQVRGRGDAFYRSRWEPRAETVQGTPGFDPLALAIEEAHSRGMAVHAWINTHLVWGLADLPDSPHHLVNAHPEWLAVPRTLGRDLYGVRPDEPRYLNALVSHARADEQTEGVYSSPSDPAVQERVYSVWMDLVERYDLDGLHFDYVRYPSGEFDYSRGALERFRAWVSPRLPPERVRELDAAAARDPYAWVDALPGPWGEFRRAQITTLVERIYHGVKARRPDLTVSAAVFANRVDAYRNRYQDWPRWLDEGILDVVVPMAYSTDDARFREQIRDARGAADRRERVWAGVGAYLNGVDGTLSKVRIARDEGAGGVILFSYDWMATEGSPAGSMPFLRRVGAAAFGR
ncbi:MAG: family 10 glycosylhydrolase [Longimicrobiales bacterium]